MLDQPEHHTKNHKASESVVKDLERYRETFPDKEKNVLSMKKELAIAVSALCLALCLLMVSGTVGKFYALLLILINIFFAHSCYTKTFRVCYESIDDAKRNMSSNVHQNPDSFLQKIVICEKKMEDAFATINNAYLFAIATFILPLAAESLISEEPIMRLSIALVAIIFITGSFYTSLRLFLLSRR